MAFTRELGLELPRQAHRVSEIADVVPDPWTNRTISPGERQLNSSRLKAYGVTYATPDAPSIPAVSTINGPLENLGRVSLFTGTREVLNPDARRLEERAVREGIDIEFHQCDGKFRDWMLTPAPEAKQVLGEVVARGCGSSREVGPPGCP